MEQRTLKRGLLRRSNALGNETIRLILQSARDVIEGKGIDNFSLTDVAKEAGLTKGTLLYHFPSKEILLARLIDNYIIHLTEKFEAGKQAAQESLLYPKGVDLNVAGFIEWYRVYLKQDLSYSNFGVILLSYAAHRPQLREKVRAWYRDLFEDLKTSPCKEAIEIVLLLEGLFFLGHLGLDTLSEEETGRIINRMILLLNESVKPPIFE